MAKIVIILGSPSVKSRLYGVLDYANKALQQLGHTLERIHVRDLPAEDLLYARFIKWYFRFGNAGHLE